MAFNLYKNGYLYHVLVGFAVLILFWDFGLWWGVGATAFVACAKEAYDIRCKDDVSVENLIDFFCTLAGGVLGIFAETLKSYIL